VIVVQKFVKKNIFSCHRRWSVTAAQSEWMLTDYSVSVCWSCYGCCYICHCLYYQY